MGARLVLYIPPVALRGSSELPRITAVYRQIAAATQSTIAPVAQAWEDVGRADSTLRLHGADGVHASATGSYLSACVLLAVITARSPDRVAPLLLRRPYGSAPATVAIPDTIERSRATALQAAAWRAVRESSAILHQSSPLRPAESTWKARREPSSEQASSSSSVAKCGRPRELGLEASEDRVERCSSVSLESKRDRLVAGSGAAEGAAVTG